VRICRLPLRTLFRSKNMTLAVQSQASPAAYPFNPGGFWVMARFTGDAVIREARVSPPGFNLISSIASL